MTRFATPRWRERRTLIPAAVGTLALLVIDAAALCLYCPRPAAASPVDWFGHWAEQEIAYCFRRGMVTGYPDDTFRPGAVCSRSEFVVLLLRALGEEEQARTMRRVASSFADVPLSHWAGGYLELAFALGLISPGEGQTAAPQAPLTRSEMAVVAAKALARFGCGWQDVSSATLPFGDAVQIPREAVGSVGQLHALGLVAGDEKGLFRPNDFVSRGEAVVMSVRILQALGKLWDVEGNVVSVDKANGTLVLDTLGERLTLRYWPDTILVYRSGRRLNADAIAPGSRVGVVFTKGTFGTVSYAKIITR